MQIYNYYNKAIFNGLFGHSKHKLEYWSMSPTHYYNPHDNNYKLSFYWFIKENGRLFDFIFHLI